MAFVEEQERASSERRIEHNAETTVSDNICDRGKRSERCEVGLSHVFQASEFETSLHHKTESCNSFSAQKHDFIAPLNVICELAEDTRYTACNETSLGTENIPVTAEGEFRTSSEELTSASDDSGDSKKTLGQSNREGKQFVCEICDLKFKYPSKLKVHLLTHTKEKPYVCVICEKRYSRTCDLKDHMRTHTQERPFTCEICGSTFTLKSYLKRHLVTHGGEKPYVCEVCNMRFRRSNAMRRHELTHSQQKAFVCKVCSKTFSQLYTLRDHSRVHTDETPYSCDVCHKAFKQLRSLRYHNLIHTDEKPYLCGVCGRPFRRPSHVHRHVQLAHAKHPLEEQLNAAIDRNEQLDDITIPILS